jgi:hypothetical protein
MTKNSCAFAQQIVMDLMRIKVQASFVVRRPDVHNQDLRSVHTNKQSTCTDSLVKVNSHPSAGALYVQILKLKPKHNSVLVNKFLGGRRKLCLYAVIQGKCFYWHGKWSRGSLLW